MLLVEQKYKYLSKNKTESKMENPTHTFRYMNLVLHTSYDNCDIEEKLDEVELKEKRCFFQKKKGCSFCNVFFVWRKFNNCILSQCIVYWINSSV